MRHDEIHCLTEIERITNQKPDYFEMDKAFCSRMRAAGLECAPTGVHAWNQNPRYVPDLTARYHLLRNERLTKA